MTISPGSRLGPYEILAPLGAGGMGEVWRAKDTRLEREVAIKILPAGFAENEQFRARFEREAKTISSLNHPNICTLHDVGHEGGMHYLVMELIDGQSLADRLAKGPLPIHETLRYGAQVADALDRAHRQGIVHRDLKPGNVMITKTGAKLLDFGLARAASEQSAVQGLTELPTQAKPLTAEGTILGTFQYMAPEQLEGQEADARTDIFALGAVLYEMSTGKRAFSGTTKTSLIAAIVAAQPEPISTIQPVTPPAFEHVVRKCLEKDPDERWQSAHDVASELRWISEAGSQAGVASPLIAKRKRTDLLLRGALVLLVVAVAVLAYMLGTKGATEPSRRLVVDLAPPDGMQFSALGDFGGPAVISPDGERIAFVMDDSGLTATNRARTNTSSSPDLPGRKIWVRDLETGEVRALPGTDGAIFPFWAPDSRRIGFATDDTLKWVDISGGATFEICPTSLFRGGVWATDDTILFTPGAFDGIYRVSASGGDPVPVTKVDGVNYTTHRWPAVLPDGTHFLYLAAKHRDTSRDSGDVMIASLDGGEARQLMTGTSNAIVTNGSLLFVRQRSLYAQGITPDGQLQGEARLLAQNVMFDTGVFGGAISASRTGRLTYHVGGTDATSRALVWVDRNGRLVDEFGEKGLYWDFDVSPDGRRIAIAIGDPSREIWIYDLERRTRTRLTIGETWAGDPIWAPDGKSIYHSVMGAGSRANIVLRNLDDGTSQVVLSGSESTEPLTPQTIRLNLFSRTLDLSPDGRELLYGAGVYGGLWRLPIDPPGEKVAVVPEGPGVDNSAKFSPDGRWIAYASNESGDSRVYIVAVDNISKKWQVSLAAGALPEWRPDGRELFFVDLSGTMMSVSVDAHGNDLEIGQPIPLFQGVDWGWYRAMPGGKADFLAVAYPERAAAPRLVMMEGWGETREK